MEGATRVVQACSSKMGLLTRTTMPKKKDVRAGPCSTCRPNKVQNDSLHANTTALATVLHTSASAPRPSRVPTRPLVPLQPFFYFHE